MFDVSTLENFKEFFKAVIKREQFRIHPRAVGCERIRLIIMVIMLGRTDYERLVLPLSLSVATERICCQ